MRVARQWNRLYSEDVDAPSSIWDQAGWGPEQPGLVDGAPAHSGGLELDDLSGPFKPKQF